MTGSIVLASGALASGLLPSGVLASSFLLPDRLPSLIVLIGFWIPPAVAGWVAAEYLERSGNRSRTTLTYAALAVFIAGYAAAWFYFNLGRMPPYIPGATMDPTFAPPEAVRWLALVAGLLVLPGSAIACALAFRGRGRLLRHAAGGGRESIAERGRS